MEHKPLPITEHALIGLELCAISERLRVLSVKIRDHYGAEIGNDGRHAAEGVDRFRDKLQELVRETSPPGFAERVPSVYHCSERLRALREERNLQELGERLLGLPLDKEE